MARAMESVEPPGGNGTTSVTGLEGHACAQAVEAAARPTAIAARNLFMGECFRKWVICDFYGSATLAKLQEGICPGFRGSRRVAIDDREADVDEPRCRDAPFGAVDDDVRSRAAVWRAVEWTGREGGRRV